MGRAGYAEWPATQPRSPKAFHNRTGAPDDTIPETHSLSLLFDGRILGVAWIYAPYLAGDKTCATAEYDGTTWLKVQYLGEYRHWLPALPPPPNTAQPTLLSIILHP